MKYADILQLTPGYESVVDASIDQRNSAFWSRYIVHEDMVRALETITRSLSRNSDDAIRHFWMQGAYGTGKTYSSLVIKHLLEEPTEVVEAFLEKNPLFGRVRKAFMEVRGQGDYVVVWRSGGAAELQSRERLLMELEQMILQALEQRGYQTQGAEGLASVVRNRLEEHQASLREACRKGRFKQALAEYGDFDHLLRRVTAGDGSACQVAADMLREMGVVLATNVVAFKARVKGLLEANRGLKLFIIWDEFSEYLRQRHELQILQELSEFAKELPFYLLYVTHEAAEQTSGHSAEEIKKFEARFHKIPISLTQKTTQSLISETIQPIPGQEDRWLGVQKQLTTALNRYAPELFGDCDERLADVAKIFPFHPMSVRVMAKVAESAGAAGRSIFRFLKDDSSASAHAGFRYFIRQEGPDGWKWITPDYLWDYFFLQQTDDSQALQKTQAVLDCQRYYHEVAPRVQEDETLLRLFKCCLLLRAAVGSDRNLLRSSGATNQLRATLKTVKLCYCSALTQEEIEQALRTFEKQRIFAFTGSGDEKTFALPVAQSHQDRDKLLKEVATAYPLERFLGEKGEITRLLQEKISQSPHPIVNRLTLTTSPVTATHIRNAHSKLLQKLRANPQDYHMHVVVGQSEADLKRAKDIVDSLLQFNREVYKHYVVVLLRQTFSEQTLRVLHGYKVDAQLARQEGNTTAAASSEDEYKQTLEEWSTQAVSYELDYKQGTRPFAMAYTSEALVEQLEQAFCEEYPYAPEVISPKTSLYKAVNAQSIKVGFHRLATRRTDRADPLARLYSDEYSGVVETFRRNGLLQADSIDTLLECQEACDPKGKAVVALCELLNREISRNSSVDLAALWDTLKRDFGYANTKICGYILGFAFSFFRGRPYSYSDGGSPKPFSNEVICELVEKLCKGKGLDGQALIIGDKQEERFRRTIGELFSLKPSACIDATTCRQSLCQTIEQTGYPLWALRYTPQEACDGFHEQLNTLLSALEGFIDQTGEASAHYRQVEYLCKGSNGKTFREWFAQIWRAGTLQRQAMLSYLRAQAPVTFERCRQGEFTLEQLLTMVKKRLALEPSRWQSSAVIREITHLGNDVELLGVLSRELGQEVATLEEATRLLKNEFNSLRVPQCVFEQSGAKWLPALTALNTLANQSWGTLSSAEQHDALKTLRMHLQEAFEALRQPDDALLCYLQATGHPVSQEEVRQLLEQLPAGGYQQPQEIFNQLLEQNLATSEQKKYQLQLREAWYALTDTPSVDAWCERYGIPPVWLYPEQAEVLATVEKVTRDEPCELAMLRRATAQLSAGDWRKLRRQPEATQALLQHLAIAYDADLLLNEIAPITQFIREQTTYPIARWHDHLLELQALTKRYVQEHLLPKTISGAQLRINLMDEAELRDMLQRVLDAHQELSLLINS